MKQVRGQTISEDIDEKIRRFVVDTFLFGAANGLAPHDSLLGNGIVDSTGVLELVEFLEQEFELKVADHEIAPENLDSLANLSAYVRRKIALP